MKYSVLLLSVVAFGSLYFTNPFDNKEAGNLSEKEFNYNFNIQNLEGKTISFKKYKGKVVFLNLWATWCGPCRYEMPGIQNLFNTVGSDKIEFVMLSIDRDGEQRKVASYTKSNAYTFPVFMPSGGLTEQLNVPSIPTTFIIDKKGNVVLKHVGSTNYNSEKYRKLLTDLSKQ